MTEPERWTYAAVDRHVSDAHRNLVADLAASLDLAAGLREATIPAHHTNLVADLRDVLDIDAGLNAIAPNAIASLSSVASQPQQDTQDSVRTGAVGLAVALASVDLRTRLWLRAHPARRALASVGDIAVDLASALARALAHNDFALALARVLDPNDLAFDLDRALALALAPAPDLALALAPAPDLALARALAHDAHDALARALAHDTLARDAFALEELALGDLARDLALARRLNRTFDFAGGIRHLDRGLERACTISHGIADIQAALDDFTNADLRNIDFAKIPLEG